MSRPCTYVGRNTTKIFGGWIYGLFKRKSSVLIYQEFSSMYLKYRHREFWCAGYYVDTAEKNTKKIQEYIANQYKEDKRSNKYV